MASPVEAEIGMLDEPSESGAGAARGGAARTAFRLASDHAELWLPGSLASIAFLGWAPFVLAIVTLPTVGDLGFFGASLGISPSFPWNVVVLFAAVALGLVATSILAATGEAALLRAIDAARGRPVGKRSLDDEAARLWIVELMAALPAVLVAVATLIAIAGVAQGEYQSPDIGGPFLIRVAGDVWPLLAALGIAVIAGQAAGGSVQRVARGAPGRSLPAAIGEGLRRLGRHPARILAVTFATDLVLAGWLAASWALLRVLWEPIGRAVGEGTLLGSPAAFLLVGFVAIWLSLCAAAGALQAWASGWASLVHERSATPEAGS